MMGDYALRIGYDNEFGVLILHQRVHFPCGSSDLEWFWPFHCVVHIFPFLVRTFPHVPFNGL